MGVCGQGCTYGPRLKNVGTLEIVYSSKFDGNFDGRQHCEYLGSEFMGQVIGKSSSTSAKVVGTAIGN